MELDQLLSGFSPNLQPIRDLSERFRSDCKTVENGFALNHRPGIGSQAFALLLFTPLISETIAQYEGRFGVNIPAPYMAILEQLNGVHAFELALFGIPISMANDPPSLDRSSFAPFDVGVANRSWKREYGVDDSFFHFGSGPYSNDEHVGYFLDSSQLVRSYRKSGELVHSWDSVDAFLAEELRRAELEYPRYEEYMRKLLER